MHLPIQYLSTTSQRLEDVFCPFSAASQIRMRALYEYVDASIESLQEIRARLDPSQAGPKPKEAVAWAIARLGRICLDADNWGHDEFYRLAAGLQRALMESGGAVWTGSFAFLVEKALRMLSALVSEWDQDFRRTLAISDLLDSFAVGD